MKTLEKQLNYTFQQPALLETALTHSSFANENGVDSYERLEFLGDSILGMLVADFLFHHPSKLSEGELTRTRSSLVREESLVVVADRLGLKPMIRLGRGEQTHGARPSICADVVEAILAAIFLDGGMEPAQKMVTHFFLKDYKEETNRSTDYKTSFQEQVQKVKGSVISYALVKEEGPDHQKQFTVAVSVNQQELSQGEGKSKKEAEQQAAKVALELWKNKKPLKS